LSCGGDGGFCLLSDNPARLDCRERGAGFSRFDLPSAAVKVSQITGYNLLSLLFSVSGLSGARGKNKKNEFRYLLVNF
jgi:hypothetical protein